MGGVHGVLVGRPRRWWAVVVPLVLVACSDDPSTAESIVDETTVDTSPIFTTTTVVGGSRPVPTVPPSTLPGAGEADGGVIDASPTIAPVPVDPAAPTTTVAPPTTALVGDPQPVPGSTSPPPPPPTTQPDDPDACERLEPFDITRVIDDAIGVSTAPAPIGRDACRYAGGSFLAEVHFVSIQSIRDDWNTRPGIEPVGEVSGDAVGFSSFVPPGSPGGNGYTIAMEGGQLGVVVGVTGTGDARLVAGRIAIFANEAA